MESAIVGTTVAHLSDKDLRAIWILVPDEKTTELLSSILEPMLDMEVNLRLRDEFLRRTRDLLLPKLISGELDVSDLDINVGDAAA